MILSESKKKKIKVSERRNRVSEGQGVLYITSRRMAREHGT